MKCLMYLQLNIRSSHSTICLFLDPLFIIVIVNFLSTGKVPLLIIVIIHLPSTDKALLLL